MSDLNSERMFEGPRVAQAFEFGGTIDKPRTKDNWWFRSFSHESPPDRGLIIHVARRPRTKKDEDPHPTVRIMRINPAGVLYQKIKNKEVRVETETQFRKRMEAMEKAGKDVSSMKALLESKNE